MGLQVIGSVHGAARYITSYVTKEEAADVRQAVNGTYTWSNIHMIYMFTFTFVCVSTLIYHLL